MGCVCGQPGRLWQKRQQKAVKTLSHIYIKKSDFSAEYPWVKQCFAMAGGEAGFEMPSVGQASSATSELFLEGHLYPAQRSVPRLFSSQG